MSLLQEELNKNYDNDIISQFQFGLFDPKLIEKGSVAEITSADTYDGNNPKINGLFDPRMGVIDRDRLCPTDLNSSEICPGYHGHIRLAAPVYYSTHFMAQILKTLRCICIRCSSILVDKTDEGLIKKLLKKTGNNRFKIVYEYSIKNKKPCPVCNAVQPEKYKLLKPDKIKDGNSILKILAEFKLDKLPEGVEPKQVIDATYCRQILESITNEDCKYLGFSVKYGRPEWMICTVLPVAPPSIRPSVRQDNNQRAEDDLTFAISNIVKANKMLRQKIEENAPENIIESNIAYLQFLVATYVDNQKKPGIPQQAQRTGRPLKTITERFKGKEGRIRGNLMGKRVDFSARTVITVDPNINIDQYGIPMEIAMNMTYPEVVTSYNIEQIRKLVINGPDVYPGAISVEKKEGVCKWTSSSMHNYFEIC